MKVRLVQLDGKWPSIALMRLSAHHRARGDAVSFDFAPGLGALERGLWDETPDRVYGSIIFEWSRPLAEKLITMHPGAIIGGTGWDFVHGEQVSHTTLEAHGVTTPKQDYSIYPGFERSIGYTQRGCRMRCEFCTVPRTEGRVRAVAAVRDIYRGEPFPRELVLLDNDFFGQDNWPDLLGEIRAGGFKVCFNQGINVRLVKREEAAALAAVDYRADNMKDRRLYFAWDNLDDEERLWKGLRHIEDAGIKPRDVMIYMLIGFRARGVSKPVGPEDIFRERRIREWGGKAFPMPYDRGRRDLMGFARWVIKGWSARGVTWDAWERARYQPRNLPKETGQQAMFEEATQR